MQADRTLIQSEYFAGLDLGQASDYTALAVTEKAEFECERDPATWERRRETVLRLRYLERMPLGSPYPEMVDRVRGARIAECRLWPVTITGGRDESYGDGMYRVPKRDLITGLQVLVQTGG